MNLMHDQNATPSDDVVLAIEEFLEQVPTLEIMRDMPVIIFQDGVSGAYYIKCSLLAGDATSLCDLEAKLDLANLESFKANRKLLLKHKTYKKMVEDASAGREFNDIIVEYNTDYDSQTPLKVWGGAASDQCHQRSRNGKQSLSWISHLFQLDQKAENRSCTNLKHKYSCFQ